MILVPYLSKNTILRYYDITATNNSGLDATILYHYLDDELNGNAESSLNPFRFNGSTWDLFVVDSIETTENYVATSGVEAFSRWTLASNSLLPVELVNFDANLTDNFRVKLSWQTATEIDNDYFVVERSSNGILFEEIERISGAGTSFTTIDYQTFDERPLNGTNYYRLKQVDFDGSFDYSQIRVVEIQKEIAPLSIYPNPATTEAYIELPDGFEKYIIQVYDISGRVIFENQYDNHRGSLVELNVGDWPSGAYVVTILVDEGVLSKKLIVSND
ncbi:MAG: T9SS type A sorting domain-containing protein [Bacteroidota bacterium]